MTVRFLPLTGVVSLVVLGSAALIRPAAHSQLPGRTVTGVQPAVARTNYRPEVTIEVRDGYRYITSNGIPDHPTGQFPNSGNPNTIAPQRYHFRVPLSPKITQGARFT